MSTRRVDIYYSSRISGECQKLHGDVKGRCASATTSIPCEAIMQGRLAEVPQVAPTRPSCRVDMQLQSRLNSML